MVKNLGLRLKKMLVVKGFLMLIALAISLCGLLVWGIFELSILVAPWFFTNQVSSIGYQIPNWFNCGLLALALIIITNIIYFVFIVSDYELKSGEDLLSKEIAIVVWVIAIMAVVITIISSVLPTI